MSFFLSRVQTLVWVEQVKFSPAQIVVPLIFVSALLYSLLKAILFINKIRQGAYNYTAGFWGLGFRV